MLNNKIYVKNAVRNSILFGLFCVWYSVQGIGFDGIIENIDMLTVVFFSGGGFFSVCYTSVGYIYLNMRSWRHDEQDKEGGSEGGDNSTENQDLSKPRQVG